MPLTLGSTLFPPYNNADQVIDNDNRRAMNDPNDDIVACIEGMLDPDYCSLCMCDVLPELCEQTGACYCTK